MGRQTMSKCGLLLEGLHKGNNLVSNQPILDIFMTLCAFVNLKSNGDDACFLEKILCTC